MIKKLNTSLGKRKAKIFVLFFLCSCLAWLVSNLSESYTNTTTFNMDYNNVPDSLLLSSVSKNQIQVKLRASGFQFLGFGFKRKEIKIDIGALKNRGTTYYVPQNVYKQQIDGQLSNSIELLDLDSDTIFFDFIKVYSKEVPVISTLGITLEQNYLLDGKLQIQPNTVVVTGPNNEIDSINGVRTSPMTLSGLTSDFSQHIGLQKPKGLTNTTYSAQTVEISGTVFKFSEKIIDVPVEVLNVPEGTVMQTFPNTVPVLCKARLDELKDLNASSFSLVVDFNSIQDNPTNNILDLELRKGPENVHSAQPMETQVEYILRKE